MVNRTRLQLIALAMRDTLDLALRAGRPEPYVIRQLPGGLDLILQYRLGRYTLVLRRDNVSASPEELSVVADAFGLDLDSQLPDHYRLSHPHPDTGRPLTYHCIRLSWRETSAGTHPAGYQCAAPPEA
jgi:hypothetical protein